MITKEQFDESHNLFKLNKVFQRFIDVFLNQRDKNSYKKAITSLLLLLFTLGFILTIVETGKTLIKYVTITYTLILVPIVITLFIAVKFNNKRILKICDHLNITLDEYHDYCKIYMR